MSKVSKWDQYKFEGVNEFWGQVVDRDTKEVVYSGMSFTEAVQLTDELNHNHNESRRVYGV